MKAEDSYKYFEEAFDSIRDIFFYLPYIPTKDYTELQEIANHTKRFRQHIKEETPSELIALKQYTEGRVSWERASQLCDLGIFGLDKYCEEKNVDRRYLRVDEYYGVTIDDVDKIKEEWSKLDPQKTMEPINYTGKNKYSLEQKSDTENINIHLQKNYYNNQGKYLLSTFTYNIYQLQLMDKNLKDYEKLIEINNKLKITNIDELHYLNKYLEESLQEILENPSNINDSIKKLTSKFNDEYYHYTIKI